MVWVNFFFGCEKVSKPKALFEITMMELCKTCLNIDVHGINLFFFPPHVGIITTTCEIN